MTSLELGGPALTDPSDTLSMSPLTSRSSTPSTPLTGLTIPSPGPDFKPESISLPPSPAHDPNAQPESPVRGDDVVPSEIPLPPSPKSIKQGLPFRRPRISNPLDRVVSSTQRTSSGRRVSSALQYAMHPHPDAQPETEAPGRAVSGESDASLDLAYYQEMVNEAMSASDQELEEIPTWDSSLGFGGQVPDLVGEEGIVGDEDEAWMGYVRAQLNTLFPDYFDATAREDREGEGEGDISISTIASSDLATPPIGTRLGPGLGMGMGRGVPNIRSEIGGLTEEIERLRDVVSGLAEGMRAAQLAPEVGSGEGEVAAKPIDADGGSEIPEAFLKVRLFRPKSALLMIRRLTYQSTSLDLYIPA